MTDLPTPVADLASALAELPGVRAVVLGGSRAVGTHRPDSDWDLGVYYRGSFDPAGVRALGHPGHVSALGEWGPVVHGGAWLTVEGLPVDVLFRDLDVVERRIDDAEHGRFEIVAQNGHVAGAPTYVSAGELAIGRPLTGDVPRPSFPDALARTAPERWHGQARVALLFAGQHADPVARAGMLSIAVLSAAHARLAERREWALNEKRLVERAGLGGVHERFDSVPAVATALGVEPLAARPG